MDSTFWILLATLCIEIVSKLIAGRADKDAAEKSLQAVDKLTTVVSELRNMQQLTVARMEQFENRLSFLEAEKRHANSFAH